MSAPTYVYQVAIRRCLHMCYIGPLDVSPHVAHVFLICCSYVSRAIIRDARGGPVIVRFRLSVRILLLYCEFIYTIFKFRI